MYTITVPKRIEQIISLFHFIGYWRNDDGRDIRKWILQLWHLVTYVLFVLLLAAGAFTSDNETESVYLAVVTITALVIAVRMYYFLWKKDQIVRLIHIMGAFSTTYKEDFIKVEDKVRIFIKLISFFWVTLLCTISGKVIISLPIFTSEKVLPLNIYFPLNWKTEGPLAYWMAFGFVTYACMTTIVCMLFNVIIWYLMMACEAKYQMLGNEIRNIGTKITQKENKDLFLHELITLIINHQNLQEYKTFESFTKCENNFYSFSPRTTKRFKSFFSNLFFIQIGTSGIAICGSVYALAFVSQITFSNLRILSVGSTVPLIRCRVRLKIHLNMEYMPLRCCTYFPKYLS